MAVGVLLILRGRVSGPAPCQSGAEEPVSIGPFRLTPYPAIHSVRCPCVGARIAAAHDGLELEIDS